MWKEEVGCVFWELKSILILRDNACRQGKIQFVFPWYFYIRATVLNLGLQWTCGTMEEACRTPLSPREREGVPDPTLKAYDREQGLCSTRAAGLQALALWLGCDCSSPEAVRVTDKHELFTIAYLDIQLICSLILFLFCSLKGLGNKMLMTHKAWEIKHKSC